MKITDITVNQLRGPEGVDSRAFGGRPGRLLVQVHTDEGITGIAEGVRNLSVFRAYVDDLIKPLLVGSDPLRPRKIWEALSLGTGQHMTRFPSQIVGSIDVACWDILGKAAGMPLYQLLGGRAARISPCTGVAATAGARPQTRCWGRYKKGMRRGIAPSRYAWTGVTTARMQTRRRTWRYSRSAASGCPTSAR